MLVGVPLAFAGLSIRLLQSLKHAVLPAVGRLARDPEGVVGDVADRLSRPVRTLRRTWDDL